MAKLKALSSKLLSYRNKIEEYRNKLEKFYSWRNLTNISELSLVNIANVATVSVPVIAGVILAVESNAGIDLTLPAPLGVLYFTGLAFLIARVLTAIFCPEIIKKHRTMESYAHEKWLSKIKVKQRHENGQSSSDAEPSEVNTLKTTDVYFGLEQLSSKDEWDFYEEWLTANASPNSIRMRSCIGYLYTAGTISAIIYYILIQGSKVFLTLI